MLTDKELAAPTASRIEVTLTQLIFNELSGVLGGVPFVKFVIDRKNGNTIHFLNDRVYHLHAYYVCDKIIKESQDQFLKKIDSFNEEIYHSDDRRFYFGTLGKIVRQNRSVYTVETQEIDSMKGVLIDELYGIVKAHLDSSFELYFKPANHVQELAIAGIPVLKIPRILSSEIYAHLSFVSLNIGMTEGRVRVFKTPEAFHAALETIEWHDIIVMNRIPDDVPRVSGMINADFTTPLSHTNVLAAGWRIPNCVQRDILEFADKNGLDQKWIRYEITANAVMAKIKVIDQPTLLSKPNWVLHQIKLDQPDTDDLAIRTLRQLRKSDANKYGTKAANIGEMKHVLMHGSDRIIGFYQIKRPPRANLLHHIAHFLNVPETGDLNQPSTDFLGKFLKVPRGIALPFSMQRRFLESSPQIQQSIGKLKLALELNAHEIDSLCVSLQKLILKTKIPEAILKEIDQRISQDLAGVSTFVLRSSSNAEDLENFSAAGIYESVNHVTSMSNLHEGIKRVWSSLVSVRSVRLRQQSGIALDDSYMGVIVQEEVESGMGGVMVTTNPMEKGDFRNVYINVSLKSVIDVVQGSELPMQYLYSTVEGGGYTLSLGGAGVELSEERLGILQKIAFAGRLMQSHFSPNDIFDQPVDIEWLANKDGVYFLQLRPYAK